MTGKTYDHAALKALIDSEPANAPPRTDQAVLDWLQETATVDGRAQMADVTQYMADEGIWAAMAASSNTQVQGFLAELNMLLNQSAMDTINTRSTRFQGALTLLLSESIIDTDGQAALTALTPQSTQTRLEQAGIRKCVLGDVIAARAL